MKLPASISLIFLLTVLGCKERTENRSLVEERVPPTLAQGHAEASYEDLEGNPVSLEEFKGKKVLLNYWATWCRPCIEEMPSLLRAQEILKDENYIFLLASDQSMDKIKAFVAKKKFDFKFIRFKGSLAKIGVNALPTTFIYNEAGVQVLKLVGQTEWDGAENIERFKNLQ